MIISSKYIEFYNLQIQNLLSRNPWVVSLSVTMRPFFYFYGKYCRFFSLLKAFTLLLNCQNDLVIQISHGNPCKDLVASISFHMSKSVANIRIFFGYPGAGIVTYYFTQILQFAP